MKIYSMTATFGKLERQTLTLKPGLNVLHAPNEWGKSTWCAFLTAMFYGLDTRSHTTKSALSDREHYSPWSGSPMSGSISLSWQGRDITIQRNTKGSRPFSDFKAFETHTGLPVPELTATNCGQMLLGVERSVFLRTGFLRLTDLPVTQDESFRRRLNTLVTTGDDSGTADRLEKKLRELRNRCRYHRTGLLPQAEAEAAAAERALLELDRLQTLEHTLLQQETAARTRLKELENHRDALEYHRYRSSLSRLTEAEARLASAENSLRQQEAQCCELPQEASLQNRTRNLEELLRRQNDLKNLTRTAPAHPEPIPEIPHLRGFNPHAAGAAARSDAAACKKARSFSGLVPVLAGLLLMAIGAGMLPGLPRLPALGWGILALGAALAVLGGVLALMRHRKARELAQKYPDPDPDRWEALAIRFASQADALTRQEALRAALQEKQTALARELTAMCGTRDPREELNRCQDALKQLDALEAARRERQQAQAALDTLVCLVRPVPKPAMADGLTLSSAETAQQLQATSLLMQDLHSRLGQCRGQMDALGARQNWEQKLSALKLRITRLENHYAAAVLALDALEEARQNLQRRFSPRITRRAREILARLTQGRYQQLLLDENLSLQSAAEDEDMLRSILWRSDGTADQLWLALRLAAAEALTPGTPLVLDDALVRFDDHRLEAAMAVLKEEAENRQILLFTCHSRESGYL